jgi:SAM-dependent methyltransferase
LDGLVPQNVYDDPQFFEGYSQFRRSREGLAGAPEWPTLRSMLPPLAGARVLDLGCGFGYFSRWAAEQGAVSVLGIDLSERMLKQAQDLTTDGHITYQRSAVESLDLPGMTFDLVYSSLALHYIEDYAALCAHVRAVLAIGGRFVFSVEHPLYTAPSRPGWRTEADGSKFWPLDNYLIEGKRVTDWITAGIVKYHRSVATYVNGLLEHDFALLRLEEWRPTAEQLAGHPEWADELNRPTFLLMAAQAL